MFFLANKSDKVEQLVPQRLARDGVAASSVINIITRSVQCIRLWNLFCNCYLYSIRNVGFLTRFARSRLIGVTLLLWLDGFVFNGDILVFFFCTPHFVYSRVCRGNLGT